MPKVEEIPETIRKQIVELRNEGLTYRKIAERVKVPYSTVRSNSSEASRDCGSLQSAKSRSSLQVHGPLSTQCAA